MGVTGLWSLLEPCGRRVNIETLAGKRIAVDASIWVHQFVKAMRDERGESLPNAHLVGFFRRACRLLYHRVKPVFVFDGAAPELKARTMAARRSRREESESRVKAAAERLVMAQLKKAALTSLQNGETVVLARSGEAGPSTGPPPPPPPPPPPTENDTANDAALAAAIALSLQPAAVALASDVAVVTSGSESDDDESSSSDDDAGPATLVLPEGASLDADALAALPPSVQLELLSKAREAAALANRGKFAEASKTAPAAFSEVQLAEYLRSSTFRRRMDAVRAGGAGAQDSRAARRVAAEHGREFVLCEDDEEGGGGGAAARRPVSKKNAPPSPPPPLGLLDEAAATAAAMALGAPAPGVGAGLAVKPKPETASPPLSKPPVAAATVDISLRLPDGVTVADLLAPSSSSDDEGPGAWGDVPGTAGGEGGGAAATTARHWRERAAERQKVWSLSHGFKHGRKLGDWKDDEGGEGGDGAAAPTIVDADEDAQLQAAIAASLEPTPVKGPKEEEKEVVELSSSSSDDDGEAVVVERSPPAAAASPAAPVAAAAASPPPPAAVASPPKPPPPPAAAAVASPPKPPPAAAPAASPPAAVAPPPPSPPPPAVAMEASPPPAAAVASPPPAAAVVASPPPAAAAAVSPPPAAAVSSPQLHPTPPSAARVRPEDREEAAMAAVADAAEALAAGDDDWGAFDRGAAPPPPPPFDLEAAMEQAAAEARAARRDVARARAAGDGPTPEMYDQVQEMLSLFGLPYVIAPAEAEAQCAALDAAGLVDGVATDDNDVFLFGGRRVYRHLFADKQYVEEYDVGDVERELRLGRADFVALAQLLGCDYAPGVAGVGIVNGVEILHAFRDAGGLVGFKAWLDAPDDRLVAMVAKRSGAAVDPTANDPPALQQFKKAHRSGRTAWRVPADFPSDAVTRAFMQPRVDTSDARFVQVPPEADGLRRWCERVFGWTAERAVGLLEPALKNAFDSAPQQATMHRFLSYRQRFAKFQSARLQKAVAGIAGDGADDLMLRPSSPPSGGKGKGKRKAAAAEDDAAPSPPPAAKKGRGRGRGKGAAGGRGRGRGRGKK